MRAAQVRPQPVSAGLPARAPGILADDADPGRGALPARGGGGRHRMAGRERRRRGRARHDDRSGAASRPRRGRGSRARGRSRWRCWPRLPAARRRGRRARGSRAPPRRRRQLNYVGTIVYQHGGHVETSRLVHLNDGGEEYEKLVNLDGPAREVIRSSGEVRCYLPGRQGRPHRAAHVPQRVPVAVAAAADARWPSTTTSAWPRRERVAGHRDAGVGVRAEGRPALRPQVLGRRRDRAAAQGPHRRRAQRSRRAVRVHRRRDRRQDRPRHGEADLGRGAAGLAGAPSRAAAKSMPKDTGWTVDAGCRRGSSRSSKASGTLRGKRDPVAHLVYSDGLVAVIVFVEPIGARAASDRAVAAGRRSTSSSGSSDDYLVTVLGEAPAATVRQIAHSVARR